MSEMDARRPGVVVMPVIGFEKGVVEFLVVGPLAENDKKRGEMCPLIEGATMESLVGKKEFPGGGVKDSESLLAAARREFGVETQVSQVIDLENRLKWVFQDVPIDQLRPDLTKFQVTMGLLELTEGEIVAMEDKGATRVLLNLLNGNMIEKLRGNSLELRPAHQAMVQYLTGIARSFVGQNTEILHEEIIVA